MKMIIAILYRNDTGNVCSVLLENGIQYTIISTSGGFLKASNSTLLIGVPDDQVDSVLAMLKATCKKHEVPNRSSGASKAKIIDGSVAFVADVEQFSKI